MASNDDRVESEVASQHDGAVYRVVCHEDDCAFELSAHDGQYSIPDAETYIEGKRLTHLGQFPGHDVEAGRVVP